MARMRPEPYVAVISARRPTAVTALHALGVEAAWYVAEGDAPSYREAGARTVIEAGKLIPSRNQALEDAFSQARPCLQLSDDLTEINLWRGGKRTDPLPFPKLLALMDSYLAGDCRLVGIAPTSNTFYAGAEVKTQHFILGDLFLAAPSPIRFDESLPLKEDYDYTCQHLATYGQVARLDFILANFKHRSNKGGAVDYRTAALEQEAISILRRKWPAWIHPNPRRENEVLLRLPRRTTT
jgi:hypothetical protein